jgi:hypothetical protein
MAVVRIYRLPKTAMQSGRANTKRWVMEFEPEARRQVEPLMGWTSSPDTRQQLRMWFETEEEAVEFAKRNGHMYSIERPNERQVRPKAYADNFAYTRLLRWTH